MRKPKLPKSVRLELTDKQAKELQGLFDYAAARYKANKMGVIFAQPKDDFLRGKILDVGFVEHGFAKIITETICVARDAKQASAGMK
ncbi:MAG: hypothetical protein UR73_C0037G0009 [candidate division WS6 bacterium GW2011_GWF1_35_23]|uniref:Uncharacterized protein n=1 Tax=candidate division WS6 bacterium GW2011_GWF1_35_23 TaxID=1619097 RepID=A0A0G0EHN6_9BACT|nr:MAG: hypothetical protein UR73_C0037G0009 [candidate division WS6 bacterium GW2011_GWF1_35_23]